jgi:hypothetical protein
MELVKVVGLVMGSALVGVWAGNKAYAAVASKIPTSIPAEGARVAFEAGATTVAFIVLKSVF